MGSASHRDADDSASRRAVDRNSHRTAPASRRELEGELATRRCVTHLDKLELRSNVLWVSTRISMHIHVISFQSLVNDEDGRKSSFGRRSNEREN
ncbi:hypothetical protein AVEN_180969-1 [Araneus ventricosus]|uniref:Uncharacterized protein n=1 Tax=Araneus ventricosus TaxID=182803 RepID=A0A4Y2FL32_ARAVE|nr:hypothetical protein AVEN_180969-1 [Araneus ventricosus]